MSFTSITNKNNQNKSTDLFIKSLYLDDNLYIKNVPLNLQNFLTNVSTVVDVEPSSVCIFTGENKSDVVPTDVLKIDISNNVLCSSGLIAINDIISPNIIQMRNEIDSLKTVIYNLTNINI